MNSRSSAPHGPSLSKVLTGKGARLLALDGGGVKGVSSVLILKAIMDRVRYIEQRDGIDASNDPRKPAEYFHLAGGTSTGGLIALMLFRLQMDTDQCLLAYRTLASQIFAAPAILGLPLPGLLGKAALAANAWFQGSQFSGKPLEDAITQVVDQYSNEDPQFKYNLVSPNARKMFMCAT
ncbi:hypothetical protein LTR53_018125, partial [Teratosphaeriaceae sp. CCFEE 6253]